ncbi:MAG: hypothetical protein AAB675_05040 [Patescibacteria group bacterium]
MNRFESLIATGVFALGTVVIAAACGDKQEDLPTSTPIVTNLETPPPSILQAPGLEITPTPVETERPKPPIDFPVLSGTERISWESALESFRKTENLTRAILVENEQVRISALVGSPSSEAPSMSIRVLKPGSAQEAEDIKSLWTQKLCDAVAPAVPQGVEWNITGNNSGSMDTYGDLGFTLEAKDAFENITVCPEK